ncbi:hypothetical protein BH10PSE16_BH10PSE16_23730 [soil metagenome]
MEVASLRADPLPALPRSEAGFSCAKQAAPAALQGYGLRAAIAFSALVTRSAPMVGFHFS